ncbi:hypothetical protein STEG23_029097 [Scotinomys teguina]
MVVAKSEARRDTTTYFRTARPWPSLVTALGLGYFTWVVFWPQSVPYQSLGPLGPFTKYLVDHHHTLLRNGYWLAWLIHVGESLYAMVLCNNRKEGSLQSEPWDTAAVTQTPKRFVLLSQSSRTPEAENSVNGLCQCSFLENAKGGPRCPCLQLGALGLSSEDLLDSLVLLYGSVVVWFCACRMAAESSREDLAWSPGCARHVAVQGRLDIMEEMVEKTVEHLETEMTGLLGLLEELASNLPPGPFSPEPDLLGSAPAPDIHPEPYTLY